MYISGTVEKGLGFGSRGLSMHGIIAGDHWYTLLISQARNETVETETAKLDLSCLQHTTP